MSIFTKAGQRLADSVKALTGRVRFPGRALLFFNIDRPDRREMAEDVGDGTASDVLMTPIRWLQRSMLEAPLVAKDAAGELIENSDLVALLDRPNPFYSGDVLLAGTVLSMGLDGNAYWIAAENRDRRVVELWYAPHTHVEPKWPDQASNKFITHYDYRVGGRTQRIRPMGADDEDVAPDVEEGLSILHFREGIDLENMRKGLSALKGLLREIWTDNEAAVFTASLLRNNGIPGVVVSPADKDATLTPEEGQAAKEKLHTEYTGSGRGKPIVMLGPTKVEQFGFSPKELDLSPLRDVSEERVTAALGIPAAVVGFGSGLQQTKVGATMRELRQLAWFNGVIPMQRTIAGAINNGLAPAFDVAACEFDNGDVEALRENEDMRANRIERLYRGGIITRAEGRTELGFEAVETDKVYLHNVVAFGLIPQGVPGPTGAVQPLEANGNGNGDLPKRAPASPWFVTPSGVVLLKQHRHSPAEERIIEAAPRATPPAMALRMRDRLDQIRGRAPAFLQDRLRRVFANLGERALTSARDALEAVELAADDDTPERKQNELTPEDLALLESIFQGIGVDEVHAALQEAFEAGFLEVALEASGAIGQTFGIEFELDDAAQQRVLHEGGVRAGLVDLDQQTRDAIFDALAEGRAEGLGTDALARRIRDVVEAGPWRSVETRALIIARTEGAHAANLSTLEAARAMPETQHVQIFDNRSGFDDPVCREANGRVITIDEAEAIGLAHPNCTRSFVPINALLMEEMGL